MYGRPYWCSAVTADALKRFWSVDYAMLGVVLYIHKIISALGLANISEVYKLYERVLIATSLAPKGEDFVNAFLEGAHKGIADLF